MKIYLLADRTALIVDDKRETVSVEPRVPGVLTIGEERYELEAEGSPVPVSQTKNGICRVRFTTETGIVYKGERTSLRDGVPYSVADYASGYIPLRILLDDVARKTEELFQITADLKPDSLGHMNIHDEGV